MNRLLKQKISNLPRIELLIYAVLIAISAFLRLFRLEDRAMHHDESLHAFYSWQLSEGLGFVHNPMMHGPFQMELTAGVFVLLGDSDFTARLLYAVTGILLVLMPILFRDFLGRTGTILTSSMLCISPALVYFSRFARNDIIMAVFTFGIIICIWKYLETQKPRNLYIMSGLLALCFGTKESAFLLTGLIGFYLILVTVHFVWTEAINKVDKSQLTLVHFYKQFKHQILLILRNGIAQTNIPSHLSVFILVLALTLPQWSAGLGLFQHTPLLSWMGLTLLSTEGQIGMPTGGGKVIASLAVMTTLTFSFLIGFKWSWSIWWRCAVIFYTVWILIYTTMFTNISGGISSGIWQSLGYWIVQQGEARGGQPSHYYLLIGSLYEYLPLSVSLIASIFYFKTRDKFGLFLTYWSLSTFIIYTIASEKMPWLLVNITLPLIILSGRFLGQLSEFYVKEKLFRMSWVPFLALLPCLIAFAGWLLVFIFKGSHGFQSTAIPLLVILFGWLACALLTSIVLKNRYRGHAITILFGTAILFALLTFRTTVITSFKNSDVPVEMMVYTQTSPDLRTVYKGIEQMSRSTGQGADLPIKIDQTNGFTWPWSWYLRDYTNVSYPLYGSDFIQDVGNAQVILIHSNNKEAADTSFLRNPYLLEGIRIPHRWWFPEHTYRQISGDKYRFGMILRGLGNIDSWNNLVSYWVNREGVAKNIGSEDFFLYTTKDFPKIDLISNQVRSKR